MLKVLVQHVFDHFNELAEYSSSLSPTAARRMRVRRPTAPSDRGQVCSELWLRCLSSAWQMRAYC